MGCKGYYGHTFFDESVPFFEHKAKYGTADSTSTEKGTDNKKNNTSKYNHDYYMKNKEKWADNKQSSEESKDDKEFDVDAAARDVIRGKYGNGAERRKALGDDYEMIQKRVNELMKSEKSKDSNGSSNTGNASKASEKGNRSILEAYEELKKKK